MVQQAAAGNRLKPSLHGYRRRACDVLEGKLSRLERNMLRSTFLYSRMQQRQQVRAASPERACGPRGYAAGGDPSELGKEGGEAE